MANFEVWSVFWFLCVMCVAPVGEGVWSMCNTMKIGIDMVHGFQQWQDRCWQVVTWAPNMSTADDAWHTDTFICWLCQRARHSLGSAQNCPGPAGLQRSVYTLGAKESHRWWQSSLYGTVWAFLVSFGHVTLIKESSCGAETWLITQNLKPEKSSKENWSIVISKDDCGKLSWYQTHVLVLDFLDHGDTVCCVIVVHLAYSSHFLQRALVTLHENARRHTPNWTYSCLWLYIW